MSASTSYRLFAGGLATPIGIERAKELHDAALLGQWGGRDTNARRARCKVCGCTLAAGEGVGFDLFMRDGYRSSTVYLCGADNAALAHATAGGAT